MRGERLARQWKILQMLLGSRAGLSAAELAERLGYGVRSVYRDLQALELAGFPLFASRDGRRSRWALVEGFRHATSIPFSAEELMALEFAGLMLVPLEGSPFERGWEAALAKIRAGLPEAALEFVERFQVSFASQPGPVHDYGRYAAVLEVLQQAVRKRRVLEIDYDALSSGRRRRRVDPYGIFQDQGALYLVGRCHLRGALRHFLVDRMVLVSETGESFTRPADFDLRRYLARAFGAFLGRPERVVLCFGGRAARYVKERVWHPSQRLYERPDGVRLELEVPVSGELERFVLGWGADCEVLEPARLRHAVARILTRAAARYKSTAEGKQRPIVKRYLVKKPHVRQQDGKSTRKKRKTVSKPRGTGRDKPRGRK